MLGKRIKYYRKKKGLTQQEFGELLGFTVKNAEIRVSQYENGNRNPRPLLLNKMAEILEVKEEALLLPDLSNQDTLYLIALELKRLYNVDVIRIISESIDK